jgi:acyl-coenzyme A thioesterase PaaI-like protein
LEGAKNREMIKLKNPYADYPDYNCFGCSPNNKFGLKMVFFEDGERVISRWEPEMKFQGFHDVLHGGIQSTLIDEIASWVVFVKLGTAGVLVSRGAVTLHARLVEQRRHIATINVDLFDGKETLCTKGKVDYFLLSRERAEKEFRFPGKEAFYEQGS